MSKKTTETKPEKRAEKKQPSELKDDQLDKVQGGTSRFGLQAGQEGYAKPEGTTVPKTESVNATLLIDIDIDILRR